MIPFGLLALLLATPAFATEVVPAGPEFKISTRGYSYAYPDDGYARTPRIASASNGDFVVVWESYFDRAAGRGNEVLGRRFAADGTPRGADFTVSPSVDYLSHPDVGIDGAGNFVVTWQSYESSPIGSVWVRRYDANGHALGDAQAANVTRAITGSQSQHGLLVKPDGSFTVVWENLSTPDDDIVARRFDAGGAPLGDEFVVNATTAGNQSYPSIATDGAGDFVVVWQRGYAQPVAGRWFAPDGTPAGDEFVALDVFTDEASPGLACGPGGHCMVVSGRNASASVFDGSGATLAPRFEVAADGNYSVVAAGGDGNFVVVFRAESDYPYRLAGQRYDDTGQPLGSRFEVSAQPIEFIIGPTMPAIGVAPSGDFVVVWANDLYANYRHQYGVWGRRFAVCGNGRLTPGVPCDDGNTGAGDGCSAGCDVETCFGCAGEPSVCTAIDGCTATCSTAYHVADTATAAFGHLLPPAGDETLTLKGTIVNAALAPGAYNPAVEGAEVAITSADLVFELVAPTAVPAGLRGSGCAPLDGWRVSRTNYTYKNLSNALPPGCAPGSAKGLRGMKIKDRLARDGTIQFEVKLKAATLPPIPLAPLTATIVLGQSPGAGSAGRCARVVFPKWSFGGARARFSLI